MRRPGADITQEDLLKPYLELAAETLLWMKHRKPINFPRLEQVLRSALTNEGVHSLTLSTAHDELIIAYLDGH